MAGEWTMASFTLGLPDSLWQPGDKNVNNHTVVTPLDGQNVAVPRQTYPNGQIMNSVLPDWTRDYFERGYAQRWALRAPSDQVREEVKGLWTLLQLSPASRVIDVGCGHGKHALALAGRGGEVIGLDFATALLDRARQLAVELGVPVRWIRGDMRQVPLRSGCAHAVTLCDAFGFFDSDEEHDAVLREAARILIPGGRLAIKVVNGGMVLDDFRETERQELEGVAISITNTLTHDPPRLTQRVSIRGARGDGEYERRQRLYRADELCAVVTRGGFSKVDAYAGADGARFDPAASSAIWIIAERRSAP